MKIVIWMNYPSHYQSAFFAALRARGVDLRVYYYEKVPGERIALGWQTGGDRPEGERSLRPGESVDEVLDASRDFVHIVLPSLGSPVVRRLLRGVVARRMEWLIWSEPARPGLRRAAVLLAKRRLGRTLNRCGLGALAIGRRAEDEYRAWGIDRNKIACLPYSAPAAPRDAEPDATCRDFCGQRKAFVFLGSLCQRKGVDLLLQAFATAHGRPGGENWRLLLVGSAGPDGHYQRLARELGVSEACCFRGAVPADRIPKVLKAADVLVLPSRFDGWGVVVNEAASAGKALIASDQVGAANHLIDPGVNGFRVESGNRASLAEAMAAYVTDASLAGKHGSASAALYAAFSAERNAERLVLAVESFRALRAQGRDSCGACLGNTADAGASTLPPERPLPPRKHRNDGIA